jgi:hypothetical protein
MHSLSFSLSRTHTPRTHANTHTHEYTHARTHKHTGLYDTWHATVAEGNAEGGDHETQEGGGGWSRSGEGGEGLLRTHTIITTESNSQLGWLHERWVRIQT